MSEIIGVGTSHTVMDRLNSQIGSFAILSEEDRMAAIAASVAGLSFLTDGDPGGGKTNLAKVIAKSIGGSFGRTQGDPQALVSDITGHRSYNQETREWDFVEGPLFNNVVLVDEFPRYTGDVQSAFIEAMEERAVTVAGTTHKLPEINLFIGTQNSGDETDGIHQVTAANRDRWALSLDMDEAYGEDDLLKIHAVKMKRLAGEEPQPVTDTEQLLVARKELIGVERRMDPGLIQYAQRIVIGTREHSAVVPTNAKGTVETGYKGILRKARPALYIAQLATAMAAQENLTTVSAKHIEKAAPFVLAHRVILNYATIGKTKPAEVINEVILSTAA